ncbi:DUF4292 domain-containing protein [Bacteroides propionicifaciens]|jgi:hypothetical protein|uniref:DUF4292 domain-containing protein n=1 Tax=Bacteroides propionicifaciens TaxID=392838 RepID=UPI0003AAF031|nr:DUF4292 domain-containing protein [Bacteroides propionicifaciens]
MKQRLFWPLLLIVLFVSSCSTSRFHSASEKPYLTCRFEVIMPSQAHEKINGVLQLYKDSVIRISFRAPMVRSELALLVYSPTELLVVDRTNKLYVSEAYPIDPAYGIHVDSFDTFQNRIINASKRKKPSFFFASDFGWTAFGEATIQLYKFSDSPFEVRPTKLSRRYVSSTLNELLGSMGL